jgi:hypothetical protein
LTLPAKPSLDHFRKQAKKRARENPSLKLAEAQHQLAKEYGFKNWAELVRGVASLIADPGFATLGGSGSRWETESHSGVVHRVSVADGVVQVEQAEASGVDWHGELRYAPFPVGKGEFLDVSFSACFSRPTRLSVWIGQYRKPWASLVTEVSRFDERELGPKWTEFSFRAEIVADEPEARLNFVFGREDGLFSLRDVALRRAT